MEVEAAHFRRLHKDWLAILERVRTLEGFEEFLLPKKLESLKRAAAHGPVILLTATESSCDALIVTSTGVEHVPLSADLTGLDVRDLAPSFALLEKYLEERLRPRPLPCIMLLANWWERLSHGSGCQRIGPEATLAIRVSGWRCIQGASAFERLSNS